MDDITELAIEPNISVNMKTSKDYGLLTPQEYQAKQKEAPYIYRLEDDSQERQLTYIGFHHSFDPQNPDFKVIEDEWGKFKNRTEGKKRIAFIEGGIRDDRDSRDGAIISNGEAGLVTWLGKQDVIEVYSPEPPEDEEKDMLNKKYGKNLVDLYDFCRSADQYNRFLPEKKKVISFREYALRNSSEDNYDSIVNDYKSITGRDFSLENTDYIHELTNPYPSPESKSTVINQIARDSSDFRDQWILSGIDRHWGEGDSIFIVYGSKHALAQEVAVREITKQ